MKLYIIWALAVLFLGDSVLRTFRSNFNFGILVIYGITAMLWIYALFHDPIDAFCAVGVERVLRNLFFCGVGLFCALLAFVAVSGYSNPPQRDEQAMIVLGAALRGERLSDVLRRRLDAALAYWQQHPETLIVTTGGQGNGEALPEGQAMRDYLVAQGVPEEQILVDDTSTSTEENLRNARALLEQAGLSADVPVAVVTNAFHCYRAGCYARQAGFSQVRTLPAGISLISVMPCYFREVFAVLYYWVFKSSLTGWMHPFVGILSLI